MLLAMRVGCGRFTSRCAIFPPKKFVGHEHVRSHMLSSATHRSARLHRFKIQPNMLEVALVSIATRALTAEDWKMFRETRLRALREHPGVYFSSFKDAAERAEHEWKEMLDGKGKCIFGLFDSHRMIGLAAVFTSRDDPSGQTGVLAMDQPIEAAIFKILDFCIGGNGFSPST